MDPRQTRSSQHTLDPDGEADWWARHGSNLIEQPAYQLDNGKLHAFDPIWGLFTFEHPIFYELACAMAVRRHQLIEQLTLPWQYATIPGTTSFVRWEHIWGCAIFAYKMARRHGLSEHDALVIALIVLFADLGHSTGSHLGDWMKQGTQGGENHHDLILRAYLERTGVCDILRKYGLDPDDIINPRVVPAWAECKSPALCTDRVDYGVRETKRWMRHPLIQGLSLDSFAIHGNQLVMVSPEEAKVFGRAFMMLSWEHWSAVIHHLVEMLFMERTRRILTLGIGWDSSWLTYHPHDLLYCSDAEQMMNLGERDLYGQTLDGIMRDISSYERTRAWPGRSRRTEAFLAGDTDTGWDPYLDHHPGVEIRPARPSETEGLRVNQRGLVVVMRPFKLRQVDPPLLLGGQTVPLSQSGLDPAYAGLLKQHRQAMSRSYTATILLNYEARRVIARGLAQTQETWPSLLTRPHMDNAALQQHLQIAGSFAASHTPIRFIPD